MYLLCYRCQTWPCECKDGITLIYGDSRSILPALPHQGLLLTDPPYGINRDRGMGGGGYSGFSKKIPRKSRTYSGGWDSARPDRELMDLCLQAADLAIVWGGNYLADLLPVQGKWLVWDKQQTMPTYSDAELAWTNLSGDSVKMYRYSGNGMLAVEKTRHHPTQKPVALMRWCLGFVEGRVASVIDPFCGSGTTLIAARDLGLPAIGIELDARYADVARERLKYKALW